VPSRSDISLPYVEKSNGEKHYRLEDGGYKIIDKQKEEWLNKDNRFHRESGPAVIYFYENGNIKYEGYYLNGKQHREDGPALIQYNHNRNIICEEYHLNNIEYSKQNYLEQIKKLKSFNKIP
jgi:hypothetical protein